MPIPPVSGRQELDPDTRSIAQAMALLWTFRTRAAIHKLLGLLDCRSQDGRPLRLEDVKVAIDRLGHNGQIVESPEREGLVRLADSLRSSLYAQLLAERMAVDLQHALHGLERFHPEEIRAGWPLFDRGATVAIVRLAMFSGTPAEKLAAMAESIARVMDWDEVLAEAAFAAFDGALFKRMDPEWRWRILAQAVRRLCLAWHAPILPVADWALARAGEEVEEPEELRLLLAEMLLHQGEPARAGALLDSSDSGTAGALRACLRVQAGDYAAAQADFESAIKRRQAEVGTRRRLFPMSFAWLYPLALLARHGPAELESARKFCQGEAGERNPDPHGGWGRWVHAIDARLGEKALDKSAFAPNFASSRRPGLDDLWQVLLAAWLGPETVSMGSDHPLELLDQKVEALRRPLQACRFAWLASQLDAAATILHGREAPAPFFVSGRSEAWRETLAALAGLGREPPISTEAAGSRLLWALDIGTDGSLAEIRVFEQKCGARGWSRPRPISLARLAVSDKLPAHDAQVARAIQPDRSQPRRFVLDRAVAIQALVGHPAVALAEAPEQLVELAAGQPELEVVREGECLVLRVWPPLRPPAEQSEGLLGAEEQREREALRAITLVRDSPQRVRLYTLTVPQRRAAQLIGDGLRIPAAARAEMQKALGALASHFQIQGDQVRAERQVEAESRLRAELSPAGEDLVLRLVVAPLGPEGPRLVPGQGRSRLMAAINGETVSTRRDLQAERNNLEAVLDALDWLDEPDPGAGSYEWLVADPEAALDMVDKLPGLPAVASVDWPKGKRLRIVPVDSSQLDLRISGQRDWFRIEGQAPLEEGLVLQLSELLAASRGKSRFVPMGEGIYAALTRRLKQRLSDLAALAEVEGEALRLPRLAGAWLADTLADVPARTDGDFEAAMARLRAAQEADIGLPHGLQAELRPYQEDGVRWALRLARAGFGGCLADDMGLGKTLQALAVLVARAGGGPALVLAPTSVAGNWRAEAQRFAPGLDVRSYGEGDRDEALASLGAGQVLIASYTLFLMAAERFSAIPWHTVVADEAQAIKNAEAKRSVAVFELAADFRLALSGTPVENRLSELWSIMRFANPGLLGSLERFTERFATPIEKNRDRHAQQLLRRLVSPFILRRTKAQVLQELPPRTELLLTVSPGEEEAAHYESLRRQAAEEADRALAEGPEQARFNILAQLTRLRRAACDPRLVTPDFGAQGAKVQAFAELAAELRDNGHRALVFSQFVDFLEMLAAPLTAATISYQYLDGSTPAAERDRRVDAFQAGDGDLFLISLKAGGFGLNLTAADYVVITDPWWNPAAEDQAMGRAHRMGQTRPVTVYRMVARGTVEERIVELHRDKRALAESVLAEGEAAALPSTQDLLALLRGNQA